MNNAQGIAHFRPFARRALVQGHRTSIKLREVFWLKSALYQEAEDRYGVKSDYDLYQRIGDGLTIDCASCGVYTRDAVDTLAAFRPDELQGKNVSYGGPNVKGLLHGYCPGCGGDTVVASFDPSALKKRFGSDVSRASQSREIASFPASRRRIELTAASAGREEPTGSTAIRPHGGIATSYWRLGLAAAVVTVVLDQLTKLWLIFGFDLGSRGRVPLAPMIDLVLTWNTGISYGLFQQDSELGRWILFGIKLAAVLLLSFWLTRAGSRLTAVALGLIIGGAIGNAVDRLAYGAVADFVLFHIAAANWQFHWYVFNLADAAIVSGVIGLLYETLFPGRAAKAP